MDPAAFVMACFPLLAAPGPTNTLLATSGASIGVRRSLPLPVTALSVFVTTLMNPKAIIIAFTLLPDGASLPSRVPPLALQILLAGSARIAAGASLQRGFRGIFHPKTGYRVSAAALALLAGALGAHAFGSA